jgi:hypothetical protein
MKLVFIIRWCPIAHWHLNVSYLKAEIHRWVVDLEAHWTWKFFHHLELTPLMGNFMQGIRISHISETWNSFPESRKGWILLNVKFFEKKFFHLKLTPLRVILCGESEFYISETWKSVPEPRKGYLWPYFWQKSHAIHHINSLLKKKKLDMIYI